MKRFAKTARVAKTGAAGRAAKFSNILPENISTQARSVE
jgi:hypothetical protein